VHREIADAEKECFRGPLEALRRDDASQAAENIFCASQRRVTGARGGMPMLLTGYGFNREMAMTVGNTAVTSLSTSPGELIATAPAIADGVQSISLTDPTTGASSTLTDVLTFGAGPNDIIRLVQGANSATPVGAGAPLPCGSRFPVRTA